MKHRVINLTGVLVAVVLLCGAPAQAEQPLDNDSRVGHFLDNSNWSEVSTWLGTKEVIELADASIIIEVNSTDGDAGFQIFLDGDGLRRRCQGPICNRHPEQRRLSAGAEGSGGRLATTRFLKPPTQISPSPACP